MRRWVPVDRLETLERRIERLARRAERLGQQPPTLHDTGGRRPGGRSELALVELRGDPPRLAGWEPVAEIRHGGRGNAVEPLAPGVAIKRWVDAPPTCEHCGLRRRRQITYVLRHESGRLAQVGTSCLADFTGTTDPLNRIGARSAHAEAVAELQGAGEEGVRGAAYVPLGDLLAHVVALAEVGFVGRGEARRQRTRATYELALEGLAAEGAAPLWAHERAAEIEHWVLGELRDSPRRSAFERRLVATFELGERIHPDRAALVAAAYPAWRRARALDAYIGAPGESVEVEVEVLDVRRTERASRWGEVFWHRLHDDAGHELAWFAVGTALKPGARIRLSGSVRRHDRFASRAVTVLERCRVVEEPQPKDHRGQVKGQT